MEPSAQHDAMGMDGKTRRIGLIYYSIRFVLEELITYPQLIKKQILSSDLALTHPETIFLEIAVTVAPVGGKN